MDLSYKIKNEDRRSYPLKSWEMSDGTMVAIYQGFRGENPDLDFIVKYREPGKRLRTPSHTHWIVDLVVKGEVNGYDLNYVDGLIDSYSSLNDVGSLSVELIVTLVELFCKCEKQSTGAFMFKSMLTLIKEYLEGKKDYYQVIGVSKRV